MRTAAETSGTVQLPQFAAQDAPCMLDILHVPQAGAITGFVAAFSEGPIDFYKSQIQVQIIKSKQDPNYKRE
jgi:hypothetical protein